MVSNYQHNRQCTCNLRWIILCPSTVKPALSSTVSDRSTPCWFVERTWVSVKTWIIKHCLRFLKKIDVSSSIGPNKSLKTGKFSSAQAGVKWRFVMSQISLDYFFTIKVLFSRVPITICSSHNQFCVKLTRVCIMFSCCFVALLLL